MTIEPGSARDWQPFLTTALEHANDAIILYDVVADGRSFSIAYVNRMFEEQTGYSRAQALGKAPELMYGAQTDLGAARALSAALQSRQPARGELLKYRKDGSPFWAEVNMRPMLGIDGNLLGVVAIQRDITYRKQAEEQYTRTQALLDGLMRNTRNLIFAKDLEGRYLFVNDELARLLELDREQILGRTDNDLFPPEIAERLRANDVKARESRAPVTNEETITTSGRTLTYLSVKFALCDERGIPYATCGIATDVTTRAETMNQLQLLQIALDQASDAIVIFELRDDGTWCISYANEMMLRMTGYAREELVGNSTDVITGPQTDMASLQRWREELRQGNDVRAELTAYRKDGTAFWIEFNGSPLLTEGQQRYTVVVYRDITQKKLHEERLSFEASHDPLTGAFNRRYLEQQLERAITDACERQTEHGLIVFDLDGFKAVNDDHGHEAGDKLLSALTILISSRLRRGDILARLGGDEFALLLLGCSLEQSRHITEDLLRAIDGYGYPWKDVRLHVSASAGITAIDPATETGRDALRSADEACYAAKRSGKNRVAIARA